MTYFFRSVEDGFTLPLYGRVHLVTIFLWLAGIYLIVKNRDSLKRGRKNQVFLKLLAYLLLLDQLVLYSWMGVTGFFKWKQSLPLYHCRMAVLFFIIAILSGKRWAKILASFFGFMGTVVAMALPDLYKFSFPHYTNFQFFIVHIGMAWIIADFIFVQGFRPEKKDLIFALKFTNLFNLFVIAINLFMLDFFPDVNYGYLIRPPASLDGLLGLGTLAYQPLILVAYNIFIYLVYRLFRFLSEDEKNEKINKRLQEKL